MWLTSNNFQAVFWVAVIPAFLAVRLLFFAVHEPERSLGLRKVQSPFSLAELKRLGLAYWWVVGIAVMFSFARFSEAFLILRAQAVGLPVMLVPMVLVLMNVVYAVAAYPAGVLSDHANRTTVLGVGFGLLVAADLVFAFTKGLAGVATGVALWGLHMGFTQGLLATLVADTAPPELRGTAYFNLLCGLATLAASVLAGALWDSVGPQSTFLGGAAFTAMLSPDLLPPGGCAHCRPGRQSLIRVKSAVWSVGRSLPAPNKQTFSACVGISQTCHKRKSTRLCPKS
jgi:predicted MFS family arabinose efflux permease